MFGFHRDSKHHSDSTIARLVAAYPAGLAADVKIALGIIPIAEHEPIIEIEPVKLVGELIRIPSRVYYPEPPIQILDGLSNTQKTVVATLYTRHHNGFVRERWVEKIIGDPATWVAPFVLQLLGEYVIEIMNVLAKRSEELKERRYQQFIQENPDFCLMTCRRIVSYWECYFRRWSAPRFTDHIGYKVAKEIGLWQEHVAPRLTRNRT